MIAFLFGAAMCFNIPHVVAKAAAVTTFFVLFIIAYSLGEGPVPWTYSAEAFPISHRELGMSLAVFVGPHVKRQLRMLID